MWKPLHPIYNLWRRFFGTYVLEDPRPIHKDAPYTFYLPSKERQNSVAVGDLVKLMFRSQPAGLEYGAERMWVRVTKVAPGRVTGILDNDPFDMPQLKSGKRVRFQPFQIIDFDTVRDLPADTKQRQYWDRCLVDDCVFKENVPVYYIYREEPDMAGPDDKNPDSGWRIRGDYRNLSNKDFEARDFSYIALGPVLNADDSWIHLIDSPIGSAFMRNFESGEYEPYERPLSGDDGSMEA